METNLQLEASKAELARQILNIDNMDVLNSIRRAMGRALQRQDKVEHVQQSYTMEELNERIDRALAQEAKGQGITSSELFSEIEEKRPWLRK